MRNTLDGPENNNSFSVDFCTLVDLDTHYLAIKRLAIKYLLLTSLHNLGPMV